MTKSRVEIDLSDLRVRLAIEVLMRQARIAVEQAAMKDDAVRPVYVLNAHTTRVEHHGSCVLLRVRDQIFALSASHVFDAAGSYALLIGCGARLHALVGERFSTPKGRSGTHRDDPIDASVFHITTEIAPEVRTSALSIADLDLIGTSRANEFFVLTGYRVSKSTSTGKGHSTALERLASIELDITHYQHRRLRRDMHLLLAAEDQVLVDMKWQTAPSIRGFSGGAMFRVAGFGPHSENASASQLKLAAILTERRRGKRGQFHSAAVGTRLAVHFSLIHKYLPQLRLDEVLAEEYRRQLRELNTRSQPSANHD